MTNKTSKKVNLLPLFILIGIAVAIYFVFLSDNEAFQFNRSPQVKRLNGFPAVAYTEKELEKQRRIITNEEELAEFLNYVDDSGYLIVREDINFDKEILLGVSTSTESTTGHEIKIRKLYEDKDKNELLVSIRETEPGETCEVEQTKNVSVDLVAVDMTGMQIEFERVKQVEECD